MFVLVFVILIVISAAIEKVITIMKTSDYFCRKIEIRSKPQMEAPLLCFMKDETVQEKVDNWKSTVNRRYRRMD
jgi:hypothetical protein